MGKHYLAGQKEVTVLMWTVEYVQETNLAVSLQLLNVGFQMSIEDF